MIHKDLALALTAAVFSSLYWTIERFVCLLFSDVTVHCILEDTPIFASRGMFFLIITN